jgi:hypothetical protein
MLWFYGLLGSQPRHWPGMCRSAVLTHAVCCRSVTNYFVSGPVRRRVYRSSCWAWRVRLRSRSCSHRRRHLSIRWSGAVASGSRLSSVIRLPSNTTEFHPSASGLTSTSRSPRWLCTAITQQGSRSTRKTKGRGLPKRKAQRLLLNSPHTS